MDEILPKVAQNIPVLQDVLEQPLTPKVELSLKCAKCEFLGRCSVDKPDDWILYLPGIREKKFNNLLDQGVEAISDVPEGFDLSVYQGRVRDAIISNQEFISDNLGNELAVTNPPAYYLDFETISPAVPLYPEISPFQMIPL